MYAIGVLNNTTPSKKSRSKINTRKKYITQILAFIPRENEKFGRLGGTKEHDRLICSRIQVILQKIFLYVMLGFPGELVSLQVFQMDENGLFDVLHQSRSKLHFSF